MPKQETPELDAVHDLWTLSRSIRRYANRGLPRIDFLQLTSRLIHAFSRCDSLELRIWGSEISYRWWTDTDTHTPGNFELLPPGDMESISSFPGDPALETVVDSVVKNPGQAGTPGFTPHGSFWSADPNHPISGTSKRKSMAVLPFAIDETNSGLLLLTSRQTGLFTEQQVERLEQTAQTLGLAIADRRAQAALRERVKELTCLYGIAQLSARSGLTIDEFIAGVVELLPPALQHPGQASVKITFAGQVYRSSELRSGGPRLNVDIDANGTKQGTIAVSYPLATWAIEEDPFLPEEADLLRAVASQLSLTAEQKLAETQKTHLEEQLRHADRLATIGQLAAGLAHEINEPLANVLGFAQLAAKTANLPKPAADDIAKITKAALHARDVIRKLMLFARQMPPQTAAVQLDKLVEDGIGFIEGRCTKNDIKLVRRLHPNLPEITADPGQMLQVLINLLVNAVQAMPHGGKLTITTDLVDDMVKLIVKDTGVGMREDTRRKVFLPFFTTKDINEGTGLGLAVVHGIVTSHGGTVEVRSKIGVGSRFIVSLPVTHPTDGKQGERS
jgi:signal transduction histidine kinase